MPRRGEIARAQAARVLVVVRLPPGGKANETGAQQEHKSKRAGHLTQLKKVFAVLST